MAPDARRPDGREREVDAADILPQVDGNRRGVGRVGGAGEVGGSVSGQIRGHHLADVGGDDEPAGLEVEDSI